MDFSFCIGILFAILKEAALRSDLMFAAPGDRVTLPCPVARGSSCTSVSWTRADPLFALINPGQVMDPNVTLLSDCSLLIKHMDHSYPAVYICENGKKTWNVELQFLNITKNQENPVELQCYINNHRGLSPCTEPGLRVMWVAEDNSPLRGQRFQIHNVSNCFFKLHFHWQKQTDHLRRWRCQVQVNGSVKATASYLTTAADGKEEVFAAVATTTVIKAVTASHSGEYQCVEGGQAKTIWLHTIDIIAQMDAERHNATLSCVLTCACDPCDSDFNLTWSEADNTFINSDLIVRNRSLLIKFWIPVASLGRGDVVCSALREGVPVVTKKWCYNKSSRE
ncbi:unnamed protein product [Knipowitschia caucasica]